MNGLELIPGQMDLLDLLDQMDRIDCPDLDGGPWLLDACCGVGGATRGYQQAGFKVLGVDIDPQPNYCGDLFVQGDAVAFIRQHGHKFAYAHASWPCQRYCALTAGTNAGMLEDDPDRYPDLIPVGREVLEASGRPWVIENVAGAPIRRDLMLCGEMFGLAVQRHRMFEAGGGLTLEQHPHPKHRGRVSGYRHGEWFDGPYFAVYGDGGGKGTVAEWQAAMGIGWTDVRKEIAEAIPPAYARFVGEAMMRTLAVDVAA